MLLLDSFFLNFYSESLNGVILIINIFQLCRGNIIKYYKIKSV